MNSSTARSTSVGLTALALLLALSGCVPAQPAATTSPRPATTTPTATAAAPQSHAAACVLVQDGLKKVSALQAQASSVAGDPSKASALLDKLDAQVRSIDDTITNTTVKRVTSSARTAVDGFATYLRDAIRNPASIDVTQVQQKADDLGTRFAAVQKECS